MALLLGCTPSVNSPDFDYVRLDPGRWECTPQTFGSWTCKMDFKGTLAHVQVSNVTDLRKDIDFPTWSVETTDWQSTGFHTMNEGRMLGVRVWFKPKLPDAEHDKAARELFDMVHFKGLPKVPYQFTGPRPVIDRDDKPQP